MDMSLRQWLLIVGVVLLVIILIDGYRRVRRARRDSMEMSLGMGGEIENTPLDEHYNPELPNGGARVVRKATNGSNSTAEVSNDVPNHHKAPNIEEQLEPALTEEMPLTAELDDEPQFTEAPASSKSAIQREYIEETLTAVEAPPAPKTQPTPKPKAEEPIAKIPDPQEVIVINVLSQHAEGFKCSDLRRLFEACGMIYGDRGIFHRHEEVSQQSPIQFSVANAVEPGYFPQDKMDELRTPGISFFLSLPGPKDSMKAFDYMLETAKCVVSNLSGELKDERRSVMTKQTIEHYRQRVKDFERKQLSLRL